MLNNRKETDFFDIKLKYPDKPKGIIKDIICFSNTTHNKDCYIVFGVEDKTFNIVGVKQENRITQSNLINTINNYKFASRALPKIKIETIEIEEKELDVLIIFNTKDVPLYVEENKDGLEKGCIYSRTLDSNTIAPFEIVEKLWRKRFGLDESIKNRFIGLLENRENWEYNEEYDEKTSFSNYHNIMDPKFRIKKYESNTKEEGDSFTATLLDKKIHYYDIKLFYDKEIIDEFMGAYIDGARLFIIIPNISFIDKGFKEQSKKYRYFLCDSIEFKLFNLFYDSDNLNQYNTYLDFIETILLFKDEEEKIEFEDYIKNNFELFEKEIKDSDKDFNNKGNFAENVKTGIILNKLLIKYRETIVF